MTAKTAANLKSQFEETDPADQNTDLVDSVTPILSVTAGTAAASKAAVLGANKQLDEVHAEALYLGSGAGTQITATASEINKLDGVTATTAQINKLNSDGIIRVDKTGVDASAGGAGATTSLTVLSTGSILFDVVAVVDTAFNGSATASLEVGVSGNADKYIDSADFSASASAGTSRAMTERTTSGTAGSNDQVAVEYISGRTTLLATWTNTASATAGAVSVYVAYADMS